MNPGLLYAALAYTAWGLFPIYFKQLVQVMQTLPNRVDADWALSRDYQLDLLTARRHKRVLVLGCGSLGAPVAELLARGGVGELHLLDKEWFEAENCSRL